jgi:PncC family amidohydrolase
MDSLIIETDRIETLHDVLRRRSATVSVAESCTGGLLGGAITEVSGSSDVFLGGITAYDNSVKEQLLDVDWSVLEQHGAVSNDVAKQMVHGVRERFDTSCAVSITGIAGPTGGTDEKPVGLVFLGFQSGEISTVIRRVFDGDRRQVREQTVRTAVDELIDLLTTE